MGGSSAPGLSILTALNFMRNGRGLLQEGYDKVRLTCTHTIPGEFKQLGWFARSIMVRSSRLRSFNIGWLWFPGPRWLRTLGGGQTTSCRSRRVLKRYEAWPFYGSHMTSGLIHSFTSDYAAQVSRRACGVRFPIPHRYYQGETFAHAPGYPSRCN